MHCSATSSPCLGEVPEVSELQVVLELTDEATERPAEVAVSQLDISGQRAIFPGKGWLLVFLGWGGELSCWIFCLGANKAWVGWMLWRDFCCCF